MNLGICAFGPEQLYAVRVKLTQGDVSWHVTHRIEAMDADAAAQRLLTHLRKIEPEAALSVASVTLAAPSWRNALAARHGGVCPGGLTVEMGRPSGRAVVAEFAIRRGDTPIPVVRL